MNTDRSWRPIIFVEEPPEERDAARHLMLHILMLDSHESSFRDAVRLLEHVETLLSKADSARDDVLTISSWGTIAANHASITIANFRDTISAIASAAGQCASLKDRIDMKSLGLMVERLATAFPNHKESRDGFAHSADKMFSPEKIAKNQGEHETFFHNHLEGRRLSYMIDGKIATLDLTEESLSMLTSIKDDVYEAFRKVSVR